MRQSTLFGRTLREAPGDATTPGTQLMLRAARLGTPKSVPAPPATRCTTRRSATPFGAAND